MTHVCRQSRAAPRVARKDRMLRTEIMSAAEDPFLAIGAIMPFGGVQTGLLLGAFLLGLLTALALPAARRRIAQAANSAETADPRLACLGPAISAAVRAGELQLHYQPKLDCRTSKVCGAEALSRWTLPDGTRLQPEEFVTRAETAGGIADLTLWGVERTLADSCKLADGALGGPIFVNLSGKLITPEFAVRLIELVGD